MNKTPEHQTPNTEKRILVTGAAGFIGYHLVNRLLSQGAQVVGLDCINDYYDPQLKYDRLAQCGIPRAAIRENELVQGENHPHYRFVKMRLEDRERLPRLFEQEGFHTVINLAAQAGVRYSIENPFSYVDSNIGGFVNVLECCRHHAVKHLAYASSSSVYGLNEKMPLSTRDNVDHPVSLYAASKKANELMAHTYSHLFGLPTTGMRFFTVYGPWGRPDMAIFLFTKAMLAGQPIKVFNHGNLSRDFTYIDDIVSGILRIIGERPSGNPDWNGKQPDPSSGRAPFRVYNIGNNEPMRLMDFIGAIEAKLGMEAKKEMLPMQPGDVAATWADVSDIREELGYRPKVSVEEGIGRFVDWYRDYYELRVTSEE